MPIIISGAVSFLSIIYTDVKFNNFSKRHKDSKKGKLKENFILGCIYFLELAPKMILWSLFARETHPYGILILWLI